MERPTYEAPKGIPADLAQRMVESSRRKAVWVSPEGVAFWLNDPAQASRLAAGRGGVAFPPEINL
jgi:hypothetical protein